MVGIFAPFAKTLVTRLVGIEDEGSRSIHRSLNFAMLHNVNLNIVNLNTQTLCLSIYNRIAPPTPHQMYPLLKVEYDDPLLTPDDEISKRRSSDPYIPGT